MTINELKYDKLLLTYIGEILKINNAIEYITKSKQNFPYDYRYIILKDDNISPYILNIILKSYTDEEIDFLINELENNIHNIGFDIETKDENMIFNLENDEKVLNKCMNEYNNRF